MTRKKHTIVIFFFSIFLLIQLTSFSQTSTESAASFVLQGKVKLKDKSVEGVALELTKNGKHISKIITTKNGLYSFQLNKSSTDQQNEYLLSIVKEGIITGIVSINTYAPQSEADNTPYLFTLEIGLTPPAVAGVSVKRDFGKIKWFAEQNKFNFDPEYAKTVEKNKEEQAEASTQYISDLIEKVKKQEVDSTTLKENTETIPKETSEIAKKDQTKQTEITNANTLKKNQTDLNKNTNETAKLNKNNPNGTNQTDVNKKINETAKLNKNNQDGTLANSNIKKDTEKNSAGQTTTAKTSLQKQNVTANSKTALNSSSGLKENEKNSTTSSQIAKETNTQNTTKQETGNDSLHDQDTNPAIQLKLAGNPMGQFKKNLSVADASQNAFDGTTVFATNADENRILNEKTKMERVKAANLSKKYETSNILTSLLDVVEGSDKK